MLAVAQVATPLGASDRPQRIPASAADAGRPWNLREIEDPTPLRLQKGVTLTRAPRGGNLAMASLGSDGHRRIIATGDATGAPKLVLQPRSEIREVQAGPAILHGQKVNEGAGTQIRFSFC